MLKTVTVTRNYCVAVFFMPFSLPLLSETKREKGPSVSEVVFFKMMYKMKDLMKRTLDGEQRMTSLEIAEVTGKQHKDVMKAIRNMEPAWKKICGRNFALTSREVVQPNGGTRNVPCYSLTKTECLYVATKFNDEARAKLVLRWKQLEEERLKREMKPMTDLEIMCRATLILKKKVEQKENLIADLQPKADYCDEVLDSTDCLTMTQVAKGLGMSDYRVASLAQKHLRGRLAETLIFLSNSFGTDSDGWIHGKTTRSDIANLANMTTSNAIRTIAAFRKEGIIETEGKKIRIVKPERLQFISGKE